MERSEAASFIFLSIWDSSAFAIGLLAKAK